MNLPLGEAISLESTSLPSLMANHTEKESEVQNEQTVEMEDEEHKQPAVDSEKSSNPVPEPSKFEEEDDSEEQDDKPLSEQELLRAERSKLEGLFQRLSQERVALRVHDVIIKGNTKTKEYLIESELGALQDATSMQQIIQAASVINARLRQLDVFDSVNITLDAGPVELPGTTNVIVEVVETSSPFTGNVGIYTKPEARSWSLEGSVKVKNMFGYADLWDGSVGCGLDLTSEVSAGVALPRIKGFLSPTHARLSLLTQDWLKFSSYKDQSLGLSVGLFSSRQHDLAYNLAWRTLTDPSQLSSSAVRRQLGHNLLSSLKYTFKMDSRDSPVRPTQGYAFATTSQIGGLAPDSRTLRFLRQEFDLRYSLPLGPAALTFGLSGGVIFPWGRGFLNMPSSLPDRFFIGGNSSPVCTLGGPTALFGFKFRGLGPTEARRNPSNRSGEESSGRDVVGGDLAITAFADLSFDLPLRLFREAGIHGHAFASAGSLTKLTENEFRNLSFKRFFDSFRSAVGLGIVVPMKIFRMEVNYCYILKQFEYDNGKTGMQFSFSSPL